MNLGNVDRFQTVPKLKIRYRLEMSRPSQHLYQVEMAIEDLVGSVGSETDFHFAVWTPGSYLIREYQRNVQNLRVWSRDGKKELNWSKTSKNIWRVNNGEEKSIILRYEVYANELTVRTSHLDSSHGYFNGATLFFFLPTRMTEPCSLEIHPPPGSNWKVATGLKRIKSQENMFLAKDWEELVDCPVEVGTHKGFYFDYRGINHTVALYGEGNYDVEQLSRDISKIVDAVCSLFPEVPYDSYTFLLHVGEGLRGGLEHRNSNTSQFEAMGFRPAKSYAKFLSLLCHEFFHVYNVKRIKPEAFYNYNYDQETYVKTLWLVEGFTSYYDEYLLLSSGLVDPEIVFDLFAENIKKLEEVPGRFHQSIEQASFDTWIKFYRPDENSKNTSVSYYLKGGLVGLALDLFIRAQTNSTHSLNDVFRALWSEFYLQNQGFPDSPSLLVEFMSRVTEIDVTNFFRRYISGKDDPDFNECFFSIGFELKRDYGSSDDFSDKDKGWLGAEIRKAGDLVYIDSIRTDGPGYSSELSAGDEILALSGFRARSSNIDSLLGVLGSRTVEVLVSRKGRVFPVVLTLGNPPPNKYKIVPLDTPTVQQMQLFARWAGRPHPMFKEASS